MPSIFEETLRDLHEEGKIALHFTGNPICNSDKLDLAFSYHSLDEDLLWLTHLAPLLDDISTSLSRDFSLF